jgi:DUF3025 family protein
VRNDWRAALASPIFAPLGPLLGRLPADRFPGLDDLNALLHAGVESGGGAPLRFVLPERDVQYEMRVFRTGEVHTRERDWHDFFNALAWITFPGTKAVLNRHHVEQMSLRRGEAQRGTARDVLTLFDEGGVIVASADPALAALLRAREWKRLFWGRRDDVGRGMRFFVFGHAIYEKALEPYKGVTAKALIVDVGGDFFAEPLARQLALVDARAAAHFADSAALVSTKSLPPLPVLGVPGWDAANGRAEYYDDAAQFRPAPQPRSAVTGTPAASAPPRARSPRGDGG